METFITNSIFGFISFDEKLNILEYENFKFDEIPLKIISIREGKILDEEIKIIESVDEKFDKINLESNRKLSSYSGLKNFNKLQLSSDNIGGKHLRSNLEDILNEILKEEFKTLSNEDEILNKNLENNLENNLDENLENNLEENLNKTDNFIKKFISETYVKIASLEMKESFQEEDKLLIQSITSLDEIDESVSKLVERIREWYSIYFPEVETIHNNNSYIKLIADYGDREEIIKNNLKEFNLDIDISNGADLEKEDIDIVKGFANSIKSLQKSRKDIDAYIDIKMDKIAPNLKDLVGSTLGAKLIAHVGSIKRLALFPSGTIQILGAEKALFRHLKTGENPPKHGIIYQHPEVRGAKWWLRGKISRTLALKISLAVRKDVFSGDFDSSINESFLEKVEDIRKKHPFAPTKKQLEKRKLENKSGNRKNINLKSNKKLTDFKYIKTKSSDSPTINFKKKKRNKVKGKKLLKDLDY